MSATPKHVFLTAVGTSEGLAIDLGLFRYGVGIVVGFSSGTTAIYTVQATGGRLSTPDASKYWVDLPCLVNQTVAQTSNLAFPVTALRLVVSTLSTGGIVQLAVIQAS